MSMGIARIGDIVTGICNGPGHAANFSFTGTWLTGSPTSKADGLEIVRVGDVGTTNCTHHFSAITGSAVSEADGQSIHRIGDSVNVLEGGYGNTITGSSTVLSD